LDSTDNAVEAGLALIHSSGHTARVTLQNQFCGYFFISAHYLPRFLFCPFLLAFIKPFAVTFAPDNFDRPQKTGRLVQY
jgi:hypothetical protein